MKKFVISVFRTTYARRTFTIEAESEEQARYAAMDIATEKNDEWEGKEYDADYEVQIEEVKNDYIDRNGNPYDSEDENACLPAGGGLHKDCEYNADALYAYYVLKDRDKIFNYLTNKCFNLIKYSKWAFEVWVKGNTKIIFDVYDEGAGLWGYMHTELIK